MNGLRARLLAPTGVAIGVWLGGAGVARADLDLRFVHPVARSGAAVTAVAADPTGRLDVVPPLHGIRVYLVPMAAARSPRHQRPTGLPRDPRWVPLGRLRHPRVGVVRVRFTVPDVPEGDYTVGFWCRRCAPPQGAIFTSAYPGTRWTNTPFAKVVRVERTPVLGAIAALLTSLLAAVGVAVG